jgi:hypothetical protein
MLTLGYEMFRTFMIGKLRVNLSDLPLVLAAEMPRWNWGRARIEG